MTQRKPVVVVMGVSGCGKSTIGQMLASRLGFDFLEGDDFHSLPNVEKMKSGMPLNDSDRRDWLDALAERIRQTRQQGRSAVVSCSALKRAYRDVLRIAAPDLLLVHLVGDFTLLQQRISGRAGHYMPASLLQSQFLDLQVPQTDEHALSVPVDLPPEKILASIASAFDNLKPFRP